MVTVKPRRYSIQVYLPNVDLRDRLRDAARACGVSRNEWVRRALESALARPTMVARRGWTSRPYTPQEDRS